MGVACTNGAGGVGGRGGGNLLNGMVLSQCGSATSKDLRKWGYPDEEEQGAL